MMENISSPKLIHQLAEEPITIKRKHKYLLTSLGYVCKRKGSEIAVAIKIPVVTLKKLDHKCLKKAPVSNRFTTTSAVALGDGANNSLFVITLHSHQRKITQAI